jgi:uncharacterized membrane protein
MANTRSRSRDFFNGLLDSRAMRILIGVMVGFLALVGVGVSVAHFLREPYNEGFADHPVVTGLHVVLGGAYLALAPFQFVGRIRDRWIGHHRRAGRVLVSIGLVVGTTALFLALVVPFSGNWERLVNGPFALYLIFALVRGFQHIRAGRVALHREWMIRAFAIGLSIASMRLIFVPLIILSGDPSSERLQTLSILSFTIALVLHTLAGELWIRRGRIEEATG